MSDAPRELSLPRSGPLRSRAIAVALAGALAGCGGGAGTAGAAAAARCYPVPLGIAAARVPPGSYVSELLPTLVAADGTSRMVPVLCSRPAMLVFDPGGAAALGRARAVAVRWTTWRRGRAVGRARQPTCSTGCSARATVRLGGARAYRSRLGIVRVYTRARVRAVTGGAVRAPAFLPRATPALADARLARRDRVALAALVRASVATPPAVLAVSGQRSVVDRSAAWVRATRRGAPVVSGLARLVAGTWTSSTGFAAPRSCPEDVPIDLVRLCTPLCPGPIAAGGGGPAGLAAAVPATAPTARRTDAAAVACPLPGSRR